VKSPFKYPPNWLGGFVVGSSTLGAPNDFPVAAGVQRTIASYLYLQWREGAGADDLQAFVNAYNAIQQSYVDWFNSASLPVYSKQTGALLDWVAFGLYGFLRPLLTMGAASGLGEVNTFAVNDLVAVDDSFIIHPASFFDTSDDIFQRIITWYLYRGDGSDFSVPWLKRRVLRFLVGANGYGGLPIPSDVVMALDSFGDQVFWPTYYDLPYTAQISVQFAGNEATIRLITVIRTEIAACEPNGFELNADMAVPNDGISIVQNFPQFELATIFQAAVAAGVLELPPPYQWTVQLT
jgi:hypothetical protein